MDKPIAVPTRTDLAALDPNNPNSEAALSKYVDQEMERMGAEKVAEEWSVRDGLDQYGKGDSVYRLADGSDMVVENKYIDMERTGRTSRVARSKQRGKVKQQALTYGDSWRDRDDAADVVRAASFTNERGLRVHKTWGGEEGADDNDGHT